jgi:hypothetical protein
VAELKKEYASKLALAEERSKKRYEAFEQKIKEETDKNHEYQPSAEELDEAERMSNVEEPNINEHFNK